MSEQYYKHHIFFCTNSRDSDRKSCNDCGAQSLQEHAKLTIKKLNLSGKGNIRVNKAGCLDRCEEGPVAVVYPEGVWYTFVDTDDIDEICEKHLVNGQIVERLRLHHKAS
jgi:(2Fe-2S) ferredoxin